MPRAKYKLPDSVPILGEDFTVKSEEMKDAAGDTMGGHRRIRIDFSDHDSQDEVESTLLHETMHAILYVSGVSNLLEENVEEAIIVALEHGLHKLYARREHSE